MIRLHLLGPLALLDDRGNSISSVLAQPKRCALLAYLAHSPSPAAHRRDSLLGMFWPELDEEHARQALRQALYGLRQTLGTGAIVGTGDELIAVDRKLVWCDAAEFSTAVRDGRDATALELYRGALLDGFHLPVAPEFERWVEGESRRLAGLAGQAAWRLVEQAANDRSKARDWAERALELAPYDEEGLRRYLTLMGEHGQPAAAARAYDAFVRRLAADLELEPAAETVALAERVRAGRRGGARVDQRRELEPTPSVGELPAIAPPTADSYSGGAVTAVPVPVAASLSRSHGLAGSPRIRRAVLVVMPLVVLLGGALLLHSADDRPDAPPDPPRNALAVLPFQNLSTEQAHDYFAAGLHDELLTQLSKVADLSLRGRSSVMGYAGTTKSAREIARELAVGTLVEGSVQVVGDRLRVNVKLIDASTDAHLWAESYDRMLDDAFAIQSDIAQRVVAAVGATLGADEQRALSEAPTQVAEAYNYYLQGRGYYRRPGWLRQNFEIAEGLYARAIGLDPTFALAYVGLSEVHGGMHWFRYDPTPRRVALQREAAEAALRLSPDLPQAHMAVGLAHYWGQRDYEHALVEFETARRGLPNDPWPVLFVGYVNRRLGNWSDALAAAEQAARLDPRDATVHLDLLGHSLKAVGRYEEAAQAYETALSLAPDLHEAGVRRARAFVLWRGELDSLRAALARVPSDAHLGALGSVRAQHVRLLLWERRADSLLKTVVDRGEMFDEHVAFIPAALYAAWAHELRDDTTATRAAFRSAVAQLDSLSSRMPDDWRVYAARGMALAGLGRRGEALAEVRRLAESKVYDDDAFFGPVLAEERARILAHLGEADAALDELERVLDGSSFVLSAQILRIDPLWDPIRAHPRFQALLARYGAL